MNSAIIQKSAKITLLYAILSLPITYLRLSIEHTMYLDTEKRMARLIDSLPNFELYVKLTHIVNQTLLFTIFQPFVYVCVALIAYWQFFDDSELQEINDSTKLQLQLLGGLIMIQLLVDGLIMAIIVLGSYVLAFVGDVFAYLLPFPSWVFDVNLQNPLMWLSVVVVLVVEAVKFAIFSGTILLAISHFRTARWRSVNFSRFETLTLSIAIISLFGLMVLRREMTSTIIPGIGIGLEGITSKNVDEYLFLRSSVLSPIEIGFIVLIPLLLSRFIIAKTVQTKMKESQKGQLIFVGLMLLGKYLVSLVLVNPYGYEISYFRNYPLTMQLTILSDILSTVMYACLMMMWMKTGYPAYRGEMVAIDEELLYIQAVKMENYSV